MRERGQSESTYGIGGPKRLGREDDTVLIVVAVTAALLVDLLIFAFMSTH